jgi:hypothetical protein
LKQVGSNSFDPKHCYFLKRVKCKYPRKFAPTHAHHYSGGEVRCELHEKCGKQDKNSPCVTSVIKIQDQGKQ